MIVIDCKSVIYIMDTCERKSLRIIGMVATLVNKQLPKLSLLLGNSITQARVKTFFKGK